METKIIDKPITEFKGDAVVVSVFQGGGKLSGSAALVDRACSGLISKLIKKHEITGKLGETTVLYGCGNMDVDKVIVVGLGREADVDNETLRKAAGSAARKMQSLRVRRAATALHGAGTDRLDPARSVQSIVEGTQLSTYRFNVYKKKQRPHAISSLFIFAGKGTDVRRLTSAARKGEILARAQNVARDLINEPANNLTPDKFYRRVKALIAEWGLSRTVRCRYLGRDAIRRLGMGAILAVGQGSAHHERFITLEYRSSKKPLVALIGKTVTFDSGGISIKPSSGMGAMKGDMSGGAIAFAATLALARLGSKVNLMTIIPAVENMPSGSAYRPGDIIRAMNGKTIEVVSTDAEGRLTLADALVYAEKKGARLVVDVATLTGGCVVALGTLIAGLMGNDDKLIQTWMEISRLTGEKFWPLPLPEEYVKQMKSDVADMKNSGGRDASAITAGLFLKAFVDKAKWLHIDIAGKELVDRDDHYTPAGATGFGVRSLFEFFSGV